MNSSLQAVDRFYGFTPSRPEMLPFIPGDVSYILEVGCGNGAFAQCLRASRNVKEYWGVEIAESAANESKNNVDKLVFGDFESQELDLPKGYFDCIVFNDVLEHFVDPWKILVYIQSLMRPGAVVVASIPNARYWGHLRHVIIERDWKYENSGIRDRTHLRFFTRKSIIRLLSESGYNVSRIEGINKSDFTLGYQALRRALKPLFIDTEYLQFAVVASL